MAFGLNVDFSGIIGNLTSGLKSIVASKIQNLSSMVKTALISATSGSLVSSLQGMIGTSLNLNLSKLTGGMNFANALKGLPFPSLGSLNINSLYGLIDQNIGANLNNFTSTLAKRFTDINIDDLSLGTKLNTAIDSQLDSISSEIEAGIVAGKSSIDVLGSLNSLSNTQIRDFSFDPDKQKAFVDNLVDQQQSKIFNLSFNSISETSIFDNQISNLQKDSLDSFIGTTNLDFTFGSDEIIDKATVSKGAINKQKLQIFSVTEDTNPLTRKIDLITRYDKEEKTLNYLKNLDEAEFKVADNIDLVPSPPTQRFVDVTDPDTGEVIGIEDRVQGVIRPV